MKRTQVLGINCFLMGALFGIVLFAAMFLNPPKASASDLDLQVEALQLEYEESIENNENEEADLIDDLALVEVFFSETEVPEVFKGSGIKRTLKDGTIQTFDGDNFKIVPRKPKAKKPTTDVNRRTQVRTVVIQKEKSIKKNRLTLYGGSGPNNLEYNSDFTRVELDRDMLIGVGYSRQVNERVNLDIIGISNETVMGGVGYSF